MRKPDCRNCYYLVIQAWCGQPSIRICAKGHFYAVPKEQWKPRKDCKQYKSRKEVQP